MTRRRTKDTAAGRMYEVANGALYEVVDGDADLWVCRRAVDYPAGDLPIGGMIAACARCAAAIVFNPEAPPDGFLPVPKVCLQCAGIDPVPMDQE